MRIKKSVVSYPAIHAGLQSLVLSCAMAMAPGAAHAGSAAAVILMQQQQQQQKAQAASTALSSQACAPAGYVTTRSDRYEHGGAIIKNGELQYCVVKDDSPFVRPQCKKYLPAEEFVREESGRPDAIYSGMAIQGFPADRIVLFYCLPKH